MEKGNLIIASNEWKGERIKRCPIKMDNMLADDRLEEQGILKIYEYIGGCVYLDPELLGKNAAPVAEIEIIKTGEKEVKLKKKSCQFGHDDLVPLMLGQLIHFGKFYEYDIAFLDLKKNRKPNIMNH